MSTPIVPSNPTQESTPTASPPWTTLAYLALLGYVVWVPVMFVASYWVTSWFGVEPGSGPTMASQGVVGWMTNLGMAVTAGLPAWIGAWSALRARRLGGGTASVVALVLCLGIALVFLVGGVISPL